MAGRQHGVVTYAQLRSLGVSAAAVQRRLEGGRLHRIHRGVYAVGHEVLTVDGRRMAAVLACGDDAVLSHRTAAKKWGLVSGDGARWHVTVPRQSGGRQGPSSVVVHHPRRLDPRDVTVLDGVPITTIARTIVDLADVIDGNRLARAVHEAEVLRVLDVAAVHRALQRAPGRQGRRELLAVLAAHTAQPSTKSELEDRFRKLCRDHDLPVPTTNTYIDLSTTTPAEIDALFADAKVIVELDGAAVHHTRRAFERDRARDAALAARGYVVMRFTWRRLADEPAAAMADLRQALRARMTQFQETSSRSPGTRMTARAHGQ